ncbi:methyltransferase family protein [Sinobacterium norvegicum]|nr:isoprenylcysteine carboxylmethyltransferase family protein [Sinobacterium norvegicum]
MANEVLEITEFTRIYLAIFYSAVAAFYTVRIILMKRSNAGEIIFPGKRFCSTWWNHISFRFFRATIWLVCLCRLFLPAVDNYLGIVESLQMKAVILTGIVLLTLGFISTIMIHYKLGKQWRSGIDPNGPSELVSNGWYRYSRNPMFVCVAIAQFGFFLAMPSLFSLVCLMIGLYTLNSQALAEEKHLFILYPREYKDYCSHVRRWI